MVCKICTHALINFHPSLQLYYVLVYVTTVGNWGVNSVITYWIMTHMQYLGYCDLVARLSRFLGWPQPLVMELQARTALVFSSFTQALKFVVCNKIPLVTVWWSSMWCTQVHFNFWTSSLFIFHDRCAMCGNCCTHTTFDCNFSVITISISCYLISQLLVTLMRALTSMT